MDAPQISFFNQPESLQKRVGRLLHDTDSRLSAIVMQSAESHLRRPTLTAMIERRGAEP